MNYNCVDPGRFPPSKSRLSDRTSRHMKPPMIIEDIQHTDDHAHESQSKSRRRPYQHKQPQHYTKCDGAQRPLSHDDDHHNSESSAMSKLYRGGVPNGFHFSRCIRASSEGRFRDIQVMCRYRRNMDTMSKCNRMHGWMN